jgi:hypothetical protein
MPFITEEKACIQFLFDEGLLNIRMVCSECYACLSPKDYGSKKNILYAKEVIRKYQFASQLTVNHLLHSVGLITYVHTYHIVSLVISLT